MARNKTKRNEKVEEKTENITSDAMTTCPNIVCYTNARLSLSVCETKCISTRPKQLYSNGNNSRSRNRKFKIEKEREKTQPKTKRKKKNAVSICSLFRTVGGSVYA